VFEDQDILPTDIKQNREFIKALYPAGQSRTLEEMNHNIDPFATSGV
jgi:hypothetical protein